MKLTLLAQMAGPGKPGVKTPTPTPSSVNASPPSSPTPPPGHGPVAQSLHGALPKTGNGTLDSALETLTTALGRMADQLVRSVPHLVIALVVLIVTGVIVSLVGRFARNVFAKLRFRESLRDLFVLLIRIGVWFIGLAVAAGIVFPGFGLGQIAATAGLASIAIGFAFQDIFENFFAGILILWRFPFENGDFIEVEHVTGKVEEIEIRMTKIRQTDGQLVLIPNAKIYKSVLHVLTSQKSRRISITTRIALAEDVGHGRSVIHQAVAGCQTVHQDQAIEIFAQDFGPSSVDFQVTWWTGSTPLDHRRSRDEVIEAIKRGLDEAGIEIPYPYRALVLGPDQPRIIRALAAGHEPTGGTHENQGPSSSPE